MDQENKPPKEQPNNPLHGVKLATMLDDLVEEYGWEGLAMKINVNCFKNNPSRGSSLKFLRREQWAKVMVEQLYFDLKK
jgi:uncharacterized protein (DUF2132 family)